MGGMTPFLMTEEGETTNIVSKMMSDGIVNNQLGPVISRVTPVGSEVGNQRWTSLHGDTWMGRWMGRKMPVSRPVPVQQNSPRPAPLQLPSTRSYCPRFALPPTPHPAMVPRAKLLTVCSPRSNRNPSPSSSPSRTLVPYLVFALVSSSPLLPIKLELAVTAQCRLDHQGTHHGPTSCNAFLVLCCKRNASI